MGKMGLRQVGWRCGVVFGKFNSPLVEGKMSSMPPLKWCPLGTAMVPGSNFGTWYLVPSSNLPANGWREGGNPTT